MEIQIIEVALPTPPHAQGVVATDALIGELLGVDPASLAAMARTSDPMNGAAMYGLQAFMRRVLELAIQLRCAPELTLHLKTEADANLVHGWPNARIANVAMIFVWAIIRDDRWVLGLPFARLESASGIEVDPPIVIEPRLRDMPIEELVSTYRNLPESRLHSRDLPRETFPVAASELVRSHLKIDPLTLTRGMRATEAEVDAFFDGKPELRALCGIRNLLLSVLSEYRVMRIRGTCKVRLKSDADADVAGRPSARVAQLITLLAAALRADDRHNIEFLVPRTRTARNEADLRAVARTVYLDYTDEALNGLELICDGNVHFGWEIGTRTLANRLLEDVARECPHADVPFVVQLSRWVDDVDASTGPSAQHDEALGAPQ